MLSPPLSVTCSATIFIGVITLSGAWLWGKEEHILEGARYSLVKLTCGLYNIWSKEVNWHFNLVI